MQVLVRPSSSRFPWRARFCYDSSHAQCAGTFDGISAAVDWKFAPKWDLYFGMMFTQVHGGLANGYLQHSNIDPTVGLRFRF